MRHHVSHPLISSLPLAFDKLTRLTSLSPECEEVMAALDACHAVGFYWKALGQCNGQKTAVNKCLRAQRLERTARNREKAKEKREQVDKIWKEIDANS